MTSPVRPDQPAAFPVPSDGDYFATIGGFFLATRFPPIRSTPGVVPAPGDEGDYTALITAADLDADFYAVSCSPATCIGGVIEGGAPDLTVTRPDGVQAVGSTQDASSIYPASSLLPGGGNATFGYVAEEPGWYAVSTAAGEGAYDILLEAHRPGSVSAKKNTVQKVFLDFDGERVNTNVWGGPGVADPLAVLVVRRRSGA